MPELPEVESIRRDLTAALVGHRIASMVIRRRSVIRGRSRPADLLAGQTVTAVARHGKQLAVRGSAGSVVCVHLGMSGSLVLGSAGDQIPVHTHVRWRLDDGRELRFRDPRRFGGLWTFSDMPGLLAARWHRLGPDALSIRPVDLLTRCRNTARSIKAVLLDQTVVAGMGNIYTDELLFRRQIHPCRRADTLDRCEIEGLVRAMRRLLLRAAAAGGSSLRDHRRAGGGEGAFQRSHRVYGRAYQPCPVCGMALVSGLVAQRSTTWCAGCQGT